MKTLATRLAARLEPDTNGGCMLWTGYLNPTGYGQINVGKKMDLTHRVAWKLANGPVPEGLFVLHRCDVRACANPNHLFLGTAADNAADRDAKGRHRCGGVRGERHGRAKLTSASALSIRALLAAGEGNQQTIAKTFGISQSAVSRVKRRVSWQDQPIND